MTDAATHFAGVPLAGARALCVFVHGRGWTPGRTCEAVMDRLTTPGVAYALPEAAGNSWYAAKAVDALTGDTRASLAAAVAQVAGVIDVMRAGAPGVPLVLAGFSQGACVALELAFGGGRPDALVALTGCRVGQAEDPRAQSLPKGLPVYLSGGDNDPWIPVAAFAGAVAELGAAGAALRADLFPGRPHEMSGPELAMLDCVLADLAAGRAPGFGASR